MMGQLKHEQEQLFYEFRLDEVVPGDHLVREIAAVLDLTWVRAELASSWPPCRCSACRGSRPHEDAAEDEAEARYARATDDVEAAARGHDRQYEGKDGQADIVGHRHRQLEGEHGDEVHRPYAGSQSVLGWHS